MDTLTNLQNSLTSNVTSTVNDQLSKLFAQFVIPSIIVTAVILIVYIARAIHRYRVDKAVFEIRDTLRAMKASEAQRTAELLTAPQDQEETTNR